VFVQNRKVIKKGSKSPKGTGHWKGKREPNEGVEKAGGGLKRAVKSQITGENQIRKVG